VSDVTTDPITHTLELVADKCGDPTDLVYQRLFAQYPDLKPLFLLDKDDSAKGNMLSQVLECFLDFGDTGHYAISLISCERINHEHIGVPPETFDTFFTTIAETFKDVLKDDWTPEIDKAWASLLTNLTDAVHAEQ
jgi:hemoglobin-like flavoprotein